MRFALALLLLITGCPSEDDDDGEPDDSGLPTEDAAPGSDAAAEDVASLEDASGNVAPIVTIAPVAPVIFPALTAMLDAEVRDDGPGPLVLAWVMVDGPAPATFTDPAAADTTVQFVAPGTYTLQLSANDGELEPSLVITVQPMGVIFSLAS